MSGVRFQFHAEPEELLADLLPRWVGDLRVHVAAEVGSAVTPVDGLDLIVSPTGSVPDRVVLSFLPFDVSAPSMREALMAHRDALVITVGRRSGHTLRESMVGSTTTDEAALRVWRPLVRRARRDLPAGGTWVGPTGAEQADRSHRCSHGARRLAADGIRLFAVAGSVRFVPA